MQWLQGTLPSDGIGLLSALLSEFCGRGGGRRGRARRAGMAAAGAAGVPSGAVGEGEEGVAAGDDEVEEGDVQEEGDGEDKEEEEEEEEQAPRVLACTHLHELVRPDVLPRCVFTSGDRDRCSVAPHTRHADLGSD